MDEVIKYGQAVALAAFNSRDFSSINNLIKDATTGSVNQRVVGYRAAFGAITNLAAIIDAVRQTQNVTITPALPSFGDLGYSAQRSQADFMNKAAQILATAKRLTVVMPGLRATQPTANESVAPPPTVKEPVSPSPMEVRVVSMPARLTVQEIERDEETLEIVRSTYSCVDAPVEPDLMTELKRRME